MGKIRRRFLALTGTLLGGSYLIGANAYEGLIAAGGEKEPAKKETLLFPERRREISIDAIDGIRLHAAFVPADGEDGRKKRSYCLLLHDDTASLAQCAPYARHYQEKGMDILAADLRGHGESGGKYRGYGYDDRLDVLTWIHWILKRDPEARIVIHGLGVGAAAALYALPEHIPTGVYAVIADSSYTTLSEYLLRLLKYRQNSRIPARIRLFVLRYVTKLRAGYDIKDADVMRAVSRAQTPVLFLHGDADRTVPVEMSRQLYARAQCTRDISIFPGAGHLEEYSLHPSRYREAVDAFLEKHSPDRL